MGKKAAGNGGRSGPSKAGKRHGAINYPATLSPERQRAKDMGEQQFVSPKQLTVSYEKPVLEWDKALKGAVIRTKMVTVSTEHVLDEKRGRVVYSPSFKEKSSK